MCHLTFHFFGWGIIVQLVSRGVPRRTRLLIRLLKQGHSEHKTLKAARMPLTTRLPIRLQLLTFLLFQVELRIPLTFPNILGQLLRRRAKARVAREETRLVPTPRSCSRPRPCPCRLLSLESAEEGKSKDCKEEGKTDGSDLSRSRVALALLVLVLVLVDFIH